jgi:SAM-dependent methyltransferase
MLILTTKAIMDMCNAAEMFEQTVGQDKSAIKDAQIKFREKTNHIFTKSYYNRARIWPRGYQGDYEMLEFHYRNTPLSQGIGFYVERYLLVSTLAIAVRERKELLRELLLAELNMRANPKILDIACGSCREIVELASDITRSGAEVICLDFDEEALKSSANRMALTGISTDMIKFRKYNALKMINPERNVKEFGMQDVIYSVGLFDYLDDNTLIRLLSSLYESLSPGGKLIASFKDCRRYSTFIYHWLINWNGFLQRTEEDVWALYEKAGFLRSAVTTVREKSGVIAFYTVTK